MDHTDNPRASNAYQSLTAHALAGFRFLGWINGIAALTLVAFALGIIGGDVDPPDLQQPIAAFAGGLASCAVGMLFSYLAHFSLFRQIAAGRAGRGHWLPLLISAVAYGFSVAAFVIGCWSAATASADGPKDDVGYHVSATRSTAHRWTAGLHEVVHAIQARTY
jgi:ABC-type Fe3+-siderophore transport system permease subunit